MTDYATSECPSEQSEFNLEADSGALDLKQRLRLLSDFEDSDFASPAKPRETRKAVPSTVKRRKRKPVDVEPPRPPPQAAAPTSTRAAGTTEPASLKSKVPCTPMRRDTVSAATLLASASKNPFNTLDSPPSSKNPFDESRAGSVLNTITKNPFKTGEAESMSPSPAAPSPKPCPRASIIPQTRIQQDHTSTQPRIQQQDHKSTQQTFIVPQARSYPQQSRTNTVPQTRSYPQHDHQAPQQRIRLNVGGTVFETLLSTATKSTFVKDMVHFQKDVNKEFFVDRDPKLFAPLLQALRGGVLYDTGVSSPALQAEADFYGITLPHKLPNKYTFVKEKLAPNPNEPFLLIHPTNPDILNVKVEQHRSRNEPKVGEDVLVNRGLCGIAKAVVRDRKGGKMLVEVAGEKSWLGPEDVGRTTGHLHGVRIGEVTYTSSLSALHAVLEELSRQGFVLQGSPTQTATERTFILLRV